MYPAKPFWTVRTLEGAGESVSYISLPFCALPARFSATPGGGVIKWSPIWGTISGPARRP